MEENKNITILLERFFDGETSNDEEKYLYSFFSRDDVPENLLPYKKIFNYFDKDLENELKSEEIISQPEI